MHTPASNPLLQPEQLLRYMPGVQHQRQELRLIEAAWDNLSLLSSLSTLSSKASAGGDLAQARRDFAALSEEMMRGLATEALKTALDDLGSRAQVCIDILVRNLFERTADIGFFATDGAMADYLAQPDPALRPALESRLRDYASKYTVYDNIYLFDTQAQLQACLTAQAAHSLPTSASDTAFLAEVQASHAAYTEHYAVHDFCTAASPSLLYAQPVAVAGHAQGVMCLQFKLADEAGAIFAQVQGDNPQGQDVVLALVDAQGAVIHSSDALQLPLGWRLPQATAAGTFTLRHLGRKYLTVVRDTLGFQGYAGPGWRGLAMLPLDSAFESDADEARSALMDEVAAHPDFLAGELSHIPKRSAAIQSALERSVWNGLLELNRTATDSSESARDTLFAKTLLSEIGATAQKTAAAFASALHDLQKVVMRSVLRDAHSRAELAMQILDRNLYERANDCRWWALTPQFATTLIAGSAGCKSATAVLEQINSLYTVYACLVLFDRQGRVIAVSRPDQAEQVGQVLDEPWVAHTLRQGNGQDYSVSSYGPSRFYADGPTFVYTAAVRDPQSRQGAALGGIAIVWDATGQMQSILGDCAAGLDAQDLLAFVDASGQVLHASGPDGLRQHLPALRTAQTGQPVIDLQGQLYGLGDAPGRGYREFGSSDSYRHGLRCLSLRHLCARQDSRLATPNLPAAQAGQRTAAEYHLQLATFTIAGHWLGIDARHILKAAPDTTVMSAGSARPPLLGFTQIGKQVYPVVELRSVITDYTGPLSRDADPTRQMLVLRLPPDNGNGSSSGSGKGREFALRVDTLGSMLDIDSRQLQALHASADPGAAPMVDAVVSVGNDASSKQPLLCRMSLAWLQQCTNGELVPQDLDALTAPLPAARSARE
ncbi:chemotaxis protein CheW [Rhodoferax sp. OV413]|uniref:chemotaxis protein CheW n=1 Tax=Rhodoferax sp. OV413 TaxID=1855285 RepID=UPI0021006C4D|nr:chemotaxis protein CheW [Rhodoferax sp. OV413]